ncbi:MAG: GIY-YIG nuclease family protein [Prolixibacteraceae bacterium]
MNRFYIGVTHESVQQRLDKHNTHAYGRHRYTASDTDWCVFFVIEVNNYSHAVRIERKIKSMICASVFCLSQFRVKIY